MDPDKRMEQAAQVAQTYIRRQIWRMKVPVLAAIGLMSGYTIMTHKFVPLLDINLLWLMATVMLFFMSKKKLLENFADNLQAKQTGREENWLPTQACMWTMIACTVVLAYWSTILGYFSFFLTEAEIKAIFGIP